MLLMADSLRDLSFSALMDVYREANQQHGKELAPYETEERQIMLSEQDFYAYLHDSFFCTKGARYAIWEELGKYVSALRLEPYLDGFLLEALETTPEERKKGYAVCLVQTAMLELSKQGVPVVYSHVDKTNIASINAHLRCGFEKKLDYARFIDGSANYRAYTFAWKNDEKK